MALPIAPSQSLTSPSKNEEESIPLFLNEEQEKRFNELLSVPCSVLGKFEPSQILNFTSKELMFFLTNKFISLGIIEKENSSLFISGSGVGYSLCQQRYNDVDACCFLNTRENQFTLFDKILDVYSEFIARKLGHIKEAHNSLIDNYYFTKYKQSGQPLKEGHKKVNEIFNQISKSYLRKVLIESKGVLNGSIISLGNFDITHIRGDWRRYVTETEKILIDLKGQVFYPNSNSRELTDRVRLLSNRILTIKDPQDVERNLFFRVLNSIMKGFVFVKGDDDPSSNLMETIRKKVMMDFSSGNEVFNRKFQDWLNRHFGTDHFAKFIGFLNCTSLIQNFSLPEQDKENIVQSLARCWINANSSPAPRMNGGKIKYNGIAKSIQKYPHLSKDFLSLIQGAYLMATDGQGVKGYQFSFSKENMPYPQFEISYKDPTCNPAHRSQDTSIFLKIDGSPIKLSLAFLESWRKIEMTLGEKESVEVIHAIFEDCGFAHSPQQPLAKVADKITSILLTQVKKQKNLCDLYPKEHILTLYEYIYKNFKIKNFQEKYLSVYFKKVIDEIAEGFVNEKLAFRQLAFTLDNLYEENNYQIFQKLIESFNIQYSTFDIHSLLLAETFEIIINRLLTTPNPRLSEAFSLIEIGKNQGFLKNWNLEAIRWVEAYRKKQSDSQENHKQLVTMMTWSDCSEELKKYLKDTIIVFNKLSTDLAFGLLDDLDDPFNAKLLEQLFESLSPILPYSAESNFDLISPILKDWVAKLKQPTESDYRLGRIVISMMQSEAKIDYSEQAKTLGERLLSVSKLHQPDYEKCHRLGMELHAECSNLNPDEKDEACLTFLKGMLTVLLTQKGDDIEALKDYLSKYSIINNANISKLIPKIEAILTSDKPTNFISLFVNLVVLAINDHPKIGIDLWEKIRTLDTGKSKKLTNQMTEELIHSTLDNLIRINLGGAVEIWQYEKKKRVPSCSVPTIFNLCKGLLESHRFQSNKIEILEDILTTIEKYSDGFEPFKKQLISEASNFMNALMDGQHDHLEFSFLLLERLEPHWDQINETTKLFFKLFRKLEEKQGISHEKVKLLTQFTERLVTANFNVGSADFRNLLAIILRNKDFNGFQSIWAKISPKEKKELKLYQEMAQTGNKEIIHLLLKTYDFNEYESDFATVSLVIEVFTRLNDDWLLRSIIKENKKEIFENIKGQEYDLIHKLFFNYIKQIVAKGDRKIIDFTKLIYSKIKSSKLSDELFSAYFSILNSSLDLKNLIEFSEFFLTKNSSVNLGLAFFDKLISVYESKKQECLKFKFDPFAVAIKVLDKISLSIVKKDIKTIDSYFIRLNNSFIKRPNDNHLQPFFTIFTNFLQLASKDNALKNYLEVNPRTGPLVVFASNLMKTYASTNKLDKLYELYLLQKKFPKNIAEPLNKIISENLEQLITEYNQKRNEFSKETTLLLLEQIVLNDSFFEFLTIIGRSKGKHFIDKVLVNVYALSAPNHKNLDLSRYCKDTLDLTFKISSLVFYYSSYFHASNKKNQLTTKLELVLWMIEKRFDLGYLQGMMESKAEKIFDLEYIQKEKQRTEEVGVIINSILSETVSLLSDNPLLSDYFVKKMNDCLKQRLLETFSKMGNYLVAYLQLLELFSAYYKNNKVENPPSMFKEVYNDSLKTFIFFLTRNVRQEEQKKDDLLITLMNQKNDIEIGQIKDICVQSMVEILEIRFFKNEELLVFLKNMFNSLSNAKIKLSRELLPRINIIKNETLKKSQEDQLYQEQGSNEITTLGEEIGWEFEEQALEAMFESFNTNPF